jgi:hypothetical protein
MTYEKAQDSVATYVMALPTDVRFNYLTGFFFNLIEAIKRGRPDLTPEQKVAAVREFASGVSRFMQLHQQSHSVH